MPQAKSKKSPPPRERKRNRREENLSALYAIPNDVAIDRNGKLRAGVYGVVRTDLPIVAKPGRDGKPSTFVQDFSALPKACKNRVPAYREDAANARKKNCYLAEKSLYDEMRAKQTAASPQPGKGNARTATTAPAKSGTVPPWVKTNNGGKKK